MTRANSAVRGESEVRAVSMGEDGVVQLREGTSESVLDASLKKPTKSYCEFRQGFHSILKVLRSWNLDCLWEWKLRLQRVSVYLANEEYEQDYIRSQWMAEI